MAVEGFNTARQFLGGTGLGPPAAEPRDPPLDRKRNLQVVGAPGRRDVFLGLTKETLGNHGKMMENVDFMGFIELFYDS